MIKEYLKERRTSIIFYLIVIVFVIYGFVSIYQAKQNAIGPETYAYEAPEINVDYSQPDKFKKIAESENLELYFDEGKGTVQIKNTDTDYIWKGVMEEEDYDLDSLNHQWGAYLQSMFTVSYNNISQRDAPPATAYAARDCDYIEVDYIDNGVAVKYGFTELGLFITIEYTLEDGNFVARIPHDKMEEHLEFLVTTIELLPFMGAAGEGVDGYLLYPDGSGALTLYSNAAERVSRAKRGILRTYSNKDVALDEYLFPDNYERYVASMPVYGIKNDNNALLAVVTDGKEETGIITNPPGVVDLHRISLEIYVRNVFNVEMFNISTGEDMSTTGLEVQRVDNDILPRDREITYFMLSDEDANYSKMADVYRDHLMESGELVDTIEEDSELPLALEMLMGVTESQLVTEKYITMTSFDHLIEIFDRLKEQGVEDTKTLLTSWQKGGVNYPEYWPVARQLGGEKGLKELDEFIKSNPRNDVFLENNFMFAIQKNGGFSATNDIVYNGLNVPISGGFDETWYILNPQIAYNRAKDFIDEIEDYDKIGVGYEYLGRVVYPDYNSRNPFTRNETVNMWKNILSDTQATGKKTAVEGLNEYVYSNSDYLYAVPLDSFGLAITDQSVPFVQMVISGLIPYSGMAGNLSYDLDIQKLQWIEFGALPYFQLTYEDSILLKETEYNSLFTSTYDKWEDRVVGVYNEFKDNLGDLYGQQMISHDFTEDNISKVGYEDGTVIYLNYNNEDVEFEGITIPAKDYVVIGEEVR